MEADVNLYNKVRTAINNGLCLTFRFVGVYFLAERKFFMQYSLLIRI